MPAYSIELMARPVSIPPGSGVINFEPEQFADKAEAVERAKALYKAHEAEAIGWRVRDSVGKLIGIGLFGA
jgi:hypothetical protein